MEMAEVYQAAPLKPKSMAWLSSEIAISKMMNYFFYSIDADELLAKAGIERYRLRTLEYDDEICQCIETRTDAIMATRWRIEPNATRAGRWLKDELAPHVEEIFRGYLDSIWYGYSVQEVVYRSGPRLGINRVVLKPMQWFEPRPDGTLLYYPESGPPVECDPRKFLLARRRPRYENPRGEALLGRLWFPVTWRREGWGMWMHFLETFGDPIIIGQVPNYKEFIAAMQAQGVRSAVAWQSLTATDQVSTINASTPGEFASLEAALVRRIEKLILGQTLTSDTSSTGGSYAIAAVHNQVRKEKVAADVRFITQLMQQFVDRLCILNNLPSHRFILADSNGLETARAARDSVLMPVLSACGLQLARDYFTDVYDYRAEDLEPVGAQHAAHPTTMAPIKQTPDPAPGIPPTRGKSISDPVTIGQL